MKILRWFIDNSVAANLLMGFILLAGVVGLLSVEKEVFPRFSPQRAKISAFYPGASPEEIESRLCIPIEEAIHDLTGIVRIDAKAGPTWRLEDACVIQVQAKQGQDLQVLMAAMRARIQNIPNLPEGLDRIDVAEDHASGDDGVIWVALYGPIDVLTLKHLGERIQGDLTRIPGVEQAENYGEVPYEIAIEIPSVEMRRLELTFHDVADAVRRSSLDLPGGLVKTPDGDLVLRTRGQATDARTLGETPVVTRPDGTQLRLKDVAVIRDGLAERRFAWHHDGYPAQGWEIHASHDEVAVARRVKAYVAEMAPRLPEGLHLKTWYDDSLSFEERTWTLLENGLAGLVLVFLVLSVFLNTRIALWAAAGLLTALMGGLAGMWLAGVSLNMLSLFGFVLALGILVDDAIVVSESIERHQENAGGDFPIGPDGREKEGRAAALDGVAAVAAPVTLAVVTTVVMFLPGLFLSGWAKALLGPICAVMVLALGFSLVEALLILPAHLAVPSHPSKGSLSKFRWRVALALDSVIHRFYLPLLTCGLRQPYLILSLFVAAILVAAALVAGGHVRLAIQADVPKDTITVFVDVPSGTPFSRTQTLSAKVEQAYRQLREDLQRRDFPNAQNPLSGLETLIFEHWAGFWAELAPGARQRFPVETLAQEWRRQIGDIGDAKIDFIYREGDTYYDLEFAVSAPSPETLSEVTAALKEELSAFPGVFDVTDSQSEGKPQRNLVLRPEAAYLGLRLEDVAEQVRSAYVGKEVQRFQRESEEVKVVVRLPLAERRSLEDLAQLPIQLPAGGQAPLNMLADWRSLPNVSTITRQDRRQIVWVRARVDTERGDANAIYAALEEGFIKKIENRYFEVDVKVGQSREEQEVALKALWRNTLLALAVIYALLAVSFRSYGQPFLFLFAVPVAWMGSVLSHFALGLPLSMESLVGMIAAGGVVVNDSLVLLHFVQMRRRDPHRASLTDCLLEACRGRFRPIMLAFLTTLMGILPLFFETSVQAQFLIPMAVALAAGLLFGMIATLVLIPAAVVLLESYRLLRFDSRHRSSPDGA